MKAVIVYASVHHGNTKKIAEAMASVISADVIDVTRKIKPDLSGYDVIGFASGVYFHTFHERIKKCIEENLFSKGQKVFLVATCGLGYRDYTKGIKDILAKKHVSFIGNFQCRGWDTYGIFGKIGGIAKKHPNDRDLKEAQQFVLKTVCEKTIDDVALLG
ncbi:TPA: flavodoxin [Methanosarcina acetivorans]|jgi:flavodoxin|uniref:Flavodoxin domain-containing protein n=2 Tax=Methanosarcina acetivorans TaxID=2214 RepID=Q8TTR5_METAC|nr:flavodoxin family protein [Methanosarcina acetivorans]AAM03813.1 conserved hypothetical protein [Methanosarcina acetivorans C2A]HIH93322.1 flavodoxin [Methanosarcina acetivorans]